MICEAYILYTRSAAPVGCVRSTGWGEMNDLSVTIPTAFAGKDVSQSLKVTGDSLHEEIFTSTEPFVSRQRKQL